MIGSWIRQNRGLLLFMVLFGLFRTAVADWNPIPSGSMHPGLLGGDVVFVNRLAYNLKVPLTDWVLAHTGEPQRGDIVTFSSPADGRRLPIGKAERILVSAAIQDHWQLRTARFGEPLR
jgi:signal peptidase I